MRAAAALLAIALLTACQTGLPRGWTNSNPTAWGNVADAAQERIYGPGAGTAAPVLALAACGRVGAIEYAAALEGGSDTQAAARDAVRAMRSYCETLAPPMDYAALTAAMREICAVAANDTDQCLGLMVAAKRTMPK